MYITRVLLLGIVQGLTEFLPVSSSGHLILLQNYLGFREPTVFFDVLLHVGTLAAIVVFFRKELFLIILSLVKFKTKDKKFLFYRQITLALILGTIPTVFLGLIFYRMKEFFIQGTFIIAIMLLFTGVFLWVGEKFSTSNPQEKQKVSIKDALIIGLMQGVSLIPGVSRSGITISSGLMRGLGRKLSFKYSFFLFLPAVIGALILEVREVKTVPPQLILPYVIGPLVAFIIGLGALKVLKKILMEKKLAIFSWYCWILGGGILLWETVKLIK